MIRSSISCLFRQIRSLRFLTVLIIWILIVEDIVSVYRGYVVEQGLRDSIVILPFLQTNAYYPFEISPPSERCCRVLLKPRKPLKIRQFIHAKAL